MNLFSTIQTLLDDSDLIKKESKNQDSDSFTQKKVYNKPYSNNKQTYKNFDKKEQSYTPKPKDSNTNKQDKKSQSCFGLYPIDGDTFVGMYDSQKTNFRLAGIDAPEKNEAWSKESKNFLRQYIDKKVIFLDFKGKDKYDRHIVEVFVDKEKTQSVNKMLIAQGLATSESYKNSDGEKTHGVIDYAVNEANEWKAKLGGKGMWSN